MAQETRKDPRAKVLTMTVRYKSATVDEFIEHHSHDVSRGGIFIKTPSPFLPGTLLKFEIRIADDKPMLQGVGRVVWKRDAAGSGPDKPAGMGVKFIKVDEASRTLIDRLVVSKGGGVSAFDDETSVPAAEAPAAAQAPAGPPRVGAPSKSAPPAAAAAPRAGADGSVKANVRKATMIGLGAEAIAAAAAQPPRPRSNAPAAPAPAPMFPKTDSVGDMPPPEERTVMKQAAQLLEEALRGAGGSIDELGSPAAPAEAQRPTPKAPEPEPEPAVARAPVASERRPAPAAASGRGSDGRVAAAKRPSGRPQSSMPPRADAAPALVEPSGRKKGSGGRVGVSLLLVAGAAAAAYVAWQKQSPPIEAPPPAQAAAPPVTAAPLPAPTPAPTPAATATDTATAAAPPLASVVAAASAAGAIAAKVPPPASAAAPTPAAPTAAAPPPAAPRPVPGETTPAATTADKPAAPAPAPAPKPKVAAPKPPGEEGAPPPPAKPKPAPIPKPSDDNPY